MNVPLLHSRVGPVRLLQGIDGRDLDPETRLLHRPIQRLELFPSNLGIVPDDLNVQP
jgi:hypothetical protein